MMEIWKYHISSTKLSLSIPHSAQILGVQIQRGEPQMWVLVDPNNGRVIRDFFVVGTGHPFESKNSIYIGTFQLMGGNLVEHLFERKEEEQENGETPTR